MKNKCLADDCLNETEEPYVFCSFECAAYAGCFDIKTGFKEDVIQEKINKRKKNNEEPKEE